MTTTTVAILREARGYIAQGWTQFAEARNADGRPVPYNARSAVCFDAMGALRRTETRLPDANSWTLSRARLALARAAPALSCSAYNNRLQNQSEALAWFDRAILVQVLLEEKETQ